jgi:hypothetical protein
MLKRIPVLLDYGLKLYVALAGGLVGCSLVIREATQFHFSVTVTSGTETVLSSYCILTVTSFKIF